MKLVPRRASGILPGFVVALTLVVLAATARAQVSSGLPGEFVSASWSEKDGLPSTRIRAIAQGPDGYLWLGTEAGLIRFDGVRFSEPILTSPLPDSPVYALLSSRDGSLWVGYGGEGGAARVRAGQAQIFGAREGLVGGLVSGLAEDLTGTIWAAGRGGLHRLAGKRWEHVGSESGLPKGSTFSVYTDPEGNLLVSTTRGIYQRTDAHGSFRVVDSSPSLFSVVFSHDPQGRIWITDPLHGFRELRGREADGAASLPNGVGLNLMFDRRGDFWVATRGHGLWRIHQPREGALLERVLANETVSTVFEDREGNIWTSAPTGLYRLSPRRLLSETDLGPVRALAATVDGSIWVGTDRGLARLQGASRRWYDQRDGLPGTAVTTLHDDGSGNLWVATDRGVVRFVDGAFRPPRFSPGPSSPAITTMATDQQDRVWAGTTTQGIWEMSARGISQVVGPPELSAEVVYVVHRDRAGRLWAGYAHGLGVIDQGRFQRYATTAQLGGGILSTIFEDRRGRIWVGGSEGLSRFDGDRFTTIGRRNGLPGGVRAIVEDQDGFLWLGLNLGIVRLDAAEMDNFQRDPSYQIRYRWYDASDGPAGLPIWISHPGAVRGADGRLWFITESGLTIVSPRELSRNLPLPEVDIQSVVVDGTAMSPTLGTSLPARTTRLQIEYSAVTLRSQVALRFRHRLDGFDSDWIDAGSSRQAFYTALPPGDYQFRVIAVNTEGLRSQREATWRFTIQPLFYQTMWFRTLGVAAMIFLIWTAWQLRVRQIRREHALVVAERARVSREVHDTLLQSLLGVSLQLESIRHGLDASSAATAKGQLLRLRKEVQHYIRDARDSIWRLRATTARSDDLIESLRHAVKHLSAVQPVQLEFSETGRSRRLPSNVEEQIVRIGREAMGNAVRHAQATRILVQVRYEENVVVLRVSDDGGGFDSTPRPESTGHYGLVMMRERAEQLGGQFIVSTAPGHGTNVEVMLPLSEGPAH